MVLVPESLPQKFTPGPQERGYAFSDARTSQTRFPSQTLGSHTRGPLIDLGTLYLGFPLTDPRTSHQEFPCSDPGASHLGSPPMGCRTSHALPLLGPCNMDPSPMSGSFLAFSWCPCHPPQPSWPHNPPRVSHTVCPMDTVSIQHSVQ